MVVVREQDASFAETVVYGRSNINVRDGIMEKSRSTQTDNISR